MQSGIHGDNNAAEQRVYNLIGPAVFGVGKVRHSFTVIKGPSAAIVFGLGRQNIRLCPDNIFKAAFCTAVKEIPMQL